MGAPYAPVTSQPVKHTTHHRGMNLPRHNLIIPIFIGIFKRGARNRFALIFQTVLSDVFLLGAVFAFPARLLRGGTLCRFVSLPEVIEKIGEQSGRYVYI